MNLKIQYNGGIASDGMLDFYDGSTSIQGFSQSLSIATHAFINSDHIKKAPALKGAQIYLKAARRGSFISDIAILMEQNPAITGAIVGYSANIFYDFIKVLYRKVTGVFSDSDVDTKSVQKALKKEEPFFDEVAENMEGSLQRAHRPIGDGVETISIGRPRSRLILLDLDTKSWVETRDETPEIDDLTGNVTRYNAITRNGRVYVDQLGRIVPFRVGTSYPFNRVGVLTWSLHGSNSGQLGTKQLPKKISFSANQILSSSEKVKRLILTDALPAEN
ncbi:MAG: hypothetical protein AB3N20_05905 [Rhizobiaceae bacterium]